MQRRDARRSEAQRKDAAASSTPVRIVRGILAALLIVDLVQVVREPPYPPQGPWALAIVWILVAIAALLATFRPGLGALVSIIPLASVLVIGPWGQNALLVITIPLMACALGSTRVMATTLLLYTAQPVIVMLLTGRARTPSEILLGYVPLVGATAIGLLIRMLRHRHRKAGSRISELERRAKEVRAAERRALGTELSVLLSTGLADQRRHAASALALNEPSALTTTLDRLSRGAREALGQLRGLVFTVRRPGAATVSEAPAPGLVGVAEEVDDVLSGHGHAVDLDTSGVAREPSGFVRYMVADLLREGARVAVDQASPGAACAVVLASDVDRVIVELRAPGAHFAESAALTTIEDRLQATGATLDRHDDGRLRAVLPLQPRPRADGASALPDETIERHDMVRVFRWTGTIVSTVAALIFSAVALQMVWEGATSVGTTDAGSWVQAASWALTFAGFAVTCWRPLAGALVLAAATATPYLWLDYTIALDQPDIAFIGLTAVLVSHRTLWVWPLFAGLLALEWAAKGRLAVIDVTGAMLFTSAGAMIGLATQHFVGMRATQRLLLGRAASRHRRARDEVHRELAGELHDIVAHQLTLIGLQAEAQRTVHDVDELRTAIGRIDTILHSAQADLALLQHVLTSPEREPAAETTSPVPPLVTVRAAIDAAAATLADSGRSLQVSVGPAVDDADPTTRRTLVRIVRETTTNILRYSPAQAHSVLDLTQDGDRIRIRVASPLPTRPVRSADSTGAGLIGLEERVRLTGGVLIAAANGGMWVVEAELPRRRFPHPGGGHPRIGGRLVGSTMPSWIARIRIWVREMTPSLTPTRATYCFTDPSDRCMRVAICALVSPCPSHCTSSCSRGVRLFSAGAVRSATTVETSSRRTDADNGISPASA